MVESLKKVSEQVRKKIERNGRDFLGIRDRSTVFEGAVTVQNECGQAVLISLQTTTVVDQRYLKRDEKVEAGKTFTFTPEPTSGREFDFKMTVKALLSEENKKGRVVGSARVDRGGTYKLTSAATADKEGSSGSVTVELVGKPARQKSEKLAQVKGISFGFSASGWLFIYQLGVAECLQDHGVAKNPYVRIAGASGGALTGALLLYGADMPTLRDVIKKSAAQVHDNLLQDFNLRQFIFDACKEVVKDGSYKHPAFQEGRVDICYTAFDMNSKRVKQERANKFEDSGDAVMALLASATMGISGLPFNMKTQDGREVTVADGAVTQFLPVVDDHTISVKPFSDPLSMTTWGKPADVTPTQFVPTPFGVVPPRLDVLDHLYELGYHDMDQWLNKNLDKRVAAIQKARADAAIDPDYKKDPEPDRGPVEYCCDDDGVSWIDKVERNVPVTWSDMLGGSKSLKEKKLDRSSKQ